MVAPQCGEHYREPADARAQGIPVRAGRPDVTVQLLSVGVKSRCLKAGDES